MRTDREILFATNIHILHAIRSKGKLKTTRVFAPFSISHLYERYIFMKDEQNAESRGISTYKQTVIEAKRLPEATPKTKYDL
jgi:hypothetical protein